MRRPTGVLSELLLETGGRATAAGDREKEEAEAERGSVWDGCVGAGPGGGPQQCPRPRSEWLVKACLRLELRIRGS